MNRKKIVHIISSLKVGGAQALLYDLIAGLGFEQFEHCVIYFHDGPHNERLRQLGVTTVQAKGLVCLYDPVFFTRLYVLVKKIKPDLIHTALWAANFAGRLIAHHLNIPVVCAVHLGVDLDGAVRNMLDRYTFDYAHNVIAVSEGVVQSLYKKPRWIPAQKITLIPNGIDPQAVVARAQEHKKTRKELGIGEHEVVIGTVGRFIPRKNVGLLLESFVSVHNTFPHTRLMLVGTGPQELLLRQKARELGIEQNTIFVVGQSAYGYYPLFDCFVLCSQQEGLSIALLEAMSFGLPCIVTADQEKHEVIVSGENGLVVPINDSKALWQALEFCVHNTEKRTAFGAKARECLEQKFNFNVMIDAYRNVFNMLIKSCNFE